MNRLSWRVGLVGLLMLVAPISSLAAEFKSAAEALDKGKALVRKGDLDTAISAFAEAIQVDPKDAETYYWRGWAFGKKNDFGKAIADLTEAIRLDPKDARAYFIRGSAHLQKGQLRQGDCGLHRGHPARSEVCDCILLPWFGVRDHG